MSGFVDIGDKWRSTSVEEQRPIGLGTKRTIDILLALFGILLLAPLLIICFIAVIATSPGPALFSHRRVGFNGKSFGCLKFRTMVTDAPQRLQHLLESDPAAAAEWAATCKLRNDPRITPIGTILRKSSLDELPQLFNVLVGHMSFIGPRPERPEFVHELQKQIPFYMKRLSVKPGITGWAQVKYRYGSSVDDALEKLQYDLYYIKNLSLFLDFLILLNTVQVVLFARGR
jgi:exopolysaccharide production protein ExoY